MGHQHKSSVDIPEAARRPRSISSSNCSSNNFNSKINLIKNCNFNEFKSNNNDFRVGLTSVQGKLELLDSSNSINSFHSNF